MTQKVKQIGWTSIIGLFLACLGTSGASYYKNGVTHNQVEVNTASILRNQETDKELYRLQQEILKISIKNQTILEYLKDAK